MTTTWTTQDQEKFLEELGDFQQPAPAMNSFHHQLEGSLDTEDLLDLEASYPPPTHAQPASTLPTRQQGASAQTQPQRTGMREDQLARLLALGFEQVRFGFIEQSANSSIETHEVILAFLIPLISLHPLNRRLSLMLCGDCQVHPLKKSSTICSSATVITH
jgi:hypothetical protein